MGKLIKYEFIKNRTPLLVSAGVFMASELLFLFGLLFEKEVPCAIGMVLLVLCSCFIFLIPLIVGITTYTKELSNKVGFLVYMTPNSSYKILGSKFIFTTVMFIAFGALVGVVGISDLLIVKSKFDVPEDFLDIIADILSVFGINLWDSLVNIFGVLLDVLSALIMYVSLAYVSYTLSATFMQNNKARSFVAGLIFIAGFVGVIKLLSVLPTVDYAEGINAGSILIASLPVIGASIGVVLVCYAATAYMLDKKINL